MLLLNAGVRNSFNYFKVVCTINAYDSENLSFSYWKLDLLQDRVVLLLIFLICKCDSYILDFPSHESERVFFMWSIASQQN